MRCSVLPCCMLRCVPLCRIVSALRHLSCKRRHAHKMPTPEPYTLHCERRQANKLSTREAIASVLSPQGIAVTFSAWQVLISSRLPGLEI